MSRLYPFLLFIYGLPCGQSRSYDKPLTTASIATLIDRIKKQRGFEDKQLSPHVFRHTFSKQYMERGSDVLSLSWELGHSDIQYRLSGRLLWSGSGVWLVTFSS